MNEEVTMTQDDILRIGPGNQMTLHISDKTREDYDVDLDLKEETVEIDGKTLATEKLQEITIKVTKKVASKFADMKDYEDYIAEYRKDKVSL